MAEIKTQAEAFEKAKQGFEKTLASLQRELSRMRTGRANLAILDGIRVEYYGSPTPLSQVASLSTPDPRLIVIKAWDKSLLPAIEKALLAADLGLTPQNDGNVIRLPIPPLTMERRKELAKLVKKAGENAKIAVRNIRRDFKEKLEDLELPEDDLHRAYKKLQELTDEYVRKVDAAVEKKQEEILEG